VIQISFFSTLNQLGETILSRRAAVLVCTQAEAKSLWILGVDVGILDQKGNYCEDFNEGWVTKTYLMQVNVRENFENGLATRATIQSNNLSAVRGIEDVPDQFNAFIVGGKNSHCRTCEPVRNTMT
jgi:hypothetical protein